MTFHNISNLIFKHSSDPTPPSSILNEKTRSCGKLYRYYYPCFSISVKRQKIPLVKLFMRNYSAHHAIIYLQSWGLAQFPFHGKLLLNPTFIRWSNRWRHIKGCCFWGGWHQFKRVHIILLQLINFYANAIHCVLREIGDELVSLSPSNESRFYACNWFRSLGHIRLI